MSPNVNSGEPTEQLDPPCSRLAEIQDGAFKKGDCGNPEDQPPPWFDKQRFDRARQVFKKYFFSIFFCHLSGLMLIVHLPNMTETLLSTGHSSSVVTLFRRYLSTLVHIRRWYEGDIWDTNDPAHQSISLVRAMHRRVADRLNCDHSTVSQSTDKAVSEVPESVKTCPIISHTNNSSSQEFKLSEPKERVAISQYDMTLTQFAFIGLLLMKPQNVGLYCSRDDLECLIHFWRAIGYKLGMEDRYNLCNGGLDETVSICREILETELKPSLLGPTKDSAIMSKGIIQAMNSFIIFLSWEAMARLWFERFNISIDFHMGVYETVGYWLMRFTFGWLLRWSFFHSFFNFLLRIAVQEALKCKEYYEACLMKRYKITSI